MKRSLQNLFDIFYEITYNTIRDGSVPSSKILFAHRLRLINVRLENIVRLPEASNKYPA